MMYDDMPVTPIPFDKTNGMSDEFIFFMAAITIILELYIVYYRLTHYTI
jgi:hypothetical protein